LALIEALPDGDDETPVPVGPALGDVTFTVVEKLLETVPLPVGPTEGEVELAVTENPELGDELPVIGAL
jgi:hypothetical protein